MNTNWNERLQHVTNVVKGSNTDVAMSVFNAMLGDTSVQVQLIAREDKGVGIVERAIGRLVDKEKNTKVLTPDTNILAAVTQNTRDILSEMKPNKSPRRL